MNFLDRFIALCSSPILIAFATSGNCAVVDRPNIVLIISDDQSFRDFGFMGNEHVRTPNLDQLASQSACYFHGYVPTSVCRPSLATLLTGHYPHQHGVYFNHPPPGFLELRQLTAAEWRQHRERAERILRARPTLPRTLAAHGYACLQTGKHWEGDYQNVGFTHGMSRNRASDESAYGNRVLQDETVAHGNGDAGLAIGRDTMQPIVDFVDQHRDQPFFIWYAPLLPHTPFDAPEQFRQLYAELDHLPASLIEYYAQVTRFDDTVGRLIRLIEEEGLAERTVFLFVIDNGYRPAELDNPSASIPANLRSKLSPYEDGVRTPILIRWDGQVTPAQYDSVVQSIDLVPTIFAAAGISLGGSDLPGLNLLPSARGEALLPDRPAFGEVYPNDAQSLGNPRENLIARWVRAGNYKLIAPSKQFKSASQFGMQKEMLFDLARDPEEQHNLAGDPGYSDHVVELRRLLDDWWDPESEN